MYVLIIMSWFSGYVNGAGVTTQEFGTLERCEVAKKAAADTWKAWGVSADKVQLLCVPK